MKNYRSLQDNLPFAFTALRIIGQESDDDCRDDGDGDLPAGWQQLLTGIPGARLFRIVPPFGGETEWQAEITINGDVQCRRYTSELRARAWLAVQDKPTFSLSLLDLADLNRRFRASFLRPE